MPGLAQKKSGRRAMMAAAAAIVALLSAASCARSEPGQSNVGGGLFGSLNRADNQAPVRPAAGAIGSPADNAQHSSPPR